MTFFESIMEYENGKVLYTVLIIVATFVLRKIAVGVVQKVILHQNYTLRREKNMMKVVDFSSVSILLLLEFSLWGIQSSDLMFFVSSVLTVIGVAFVAQWSILANITAGLVMFFAGAIRNGEPIHIVDKDSPIIGTVENVGIFYTLIVSESGAQYLVPNVQLMQKTIITGKTALNKSEEK